MIEQVPAKFPRVFWFANLTELFERAAYYSMASFVVIYLGQLGLGTYWPAMVNTLLWFLIYFLPILSGTVADQIGFRRALLGAFVLLAAGYLLLGYPVWMGGATLAPTIEREVTAGFNVVLPAVLGVLLIGLGGSIVKPCILGTAQKTAGERATLAFAIFYVVVNMGSLFGRGVAFYVRTRPGATLSAIFAVAATMSVLAFFVVAGFYRGPETAAGSSVPGKPRKTVAEILTGMFTVIFNLRFFLFLLVSCGFFFLYNQVYVALPLYLKTVVESRPAMDIYTMANPLVIVCFQLLVTKAFGKMKPIRSMIVGTVIIGAAMALNMIPILIGVDLRKPVAGWLPVGSFIVVTSIALGAFAELFTSARMYEYVGAMAPKGQEGLFLGYANLPLAFGSLAGGPLGAFIFNEVMARGASRRPDGLLDLVPGQNTLGWVILMAIGLISAMSMWLFNRWLEKQESTG
ncbi:MAG TPA: MFS transporter [Acidobacteriota bacterium]|nr:MFS transporter [Acidobacteriota bacterium]